MRLALIALLLLAAPAVASAASMPDYSGLSYEQRLGNQVPMQAVLRDDDGAGIRLSDLANGRPLILVLGYFHCPNLCGIVRADLFAALRATAMAAGRDYSLAALSIDPEETSADAAAAKAEDLHRYGVFGAEQNWHFIIGAAADIRDIADAVGFHDQFDPQLKQFVHPVGTVFVTPGGIVSGYLLGVGYQPADVRLGVTRADLGAVAAAVLPVLLLCYHYDSTTGRYTLSILKLLRLAAALTVLTVGLTLFLAFRRERLRS